MIDPISKLKMNQVFIKIPKQGTNGTNGHLNVGGIFVVFNKHNGMKDAIIGNANKTQTSPLMPGERAFRSNLFSDEKIQQQAKYSTTIIGTLDFSPVLTGPYLRIMTPPQTTVKANKVPIDIISKSTARSNIRAMNAESNPVMMVPYIGTPVLGCTFPKKNFEH